MDLMPRQKVTILVDIKAPTSPGVVNLTFSLMYGGKEKFGEEVTLKLTVQ